MSQEEPDRWNGNCTSMKKPIFTIWLSAFAMLVLAVPCLAQNKPAPPKPPAPSFQKDVLPILRTACLGCHSAENPTSGLALNSYAGLMKGGKGGPCVVPGKSADSRMVKYMLGIL